MYFDLEVGACFAECRMGGLGDDPGRLVNDPL